MLKEGTQVINKVRYSQIKRNMDKRVKTSL